MPAVAIERLTRLPADGLSELLAASEQEGFRFVHRLVAGADRFDRPGEALFAVSAGCTSCPSSAGRESGVGSSVKW